MRVEIETLVGIEEAVRSARQTQGLDGKSAISTERWLDWLHAEHTPIRVYLLRVNWIDIPYYVAMHLVRHDKGVVPFVRTQRDTSMNPVDYDRRKAPQDAIVNYCPVLNPQSLINISRRRLCTHADNITSLAVIMAKDKIASDSNPYTAMIARVMVPDCEYRGACHELNPCGKMPTWKNLLWG